jgi:RNA polymerase sigma factor (TIGR02999 family)
MFSYPTLNPRARLFPMSTEFLDLTRLLQRWSEGDPDALQQAMPLLYKQLRDLAHQRRSRLPTSVSLNTTARVHEAYLKLAGIDGASIKDRSHFLAVASRIMRNVLVDHARARGAAKRGGGAAEVELKEDVWLAHVDVELVRALDEALKKLESVDARQGLIVEQHYFGGMTVDEIASTLDLAPRTVKRDLRSARAWLSAELSPGRE